MAVVVIAIFAAFAAWPGGGPHSAEADVDSVTPAAMIGSDGSTINISIVGDEDATDVLSVAATGSSTLDNGACTDEDAVDCGAESGPANPVTWAVVNGPFTATAILTLDCTEPEAITVTATHNGDSTPVAVVYCVLDVDEPQFVAEKDSDDDDEVYDFSWDASSGDCLIWRADDTFDLDDDGSFELSDDDQAGFFCEDSVRLTVTEDDDGDFVSIEDCDEGDEGVDDISGASVEIDISDIDSGDTVFCVWVNDEDFNFVPTVTTGQATSVTIVLASGQISCGGSTLVQVIPRSSSGGPAAAGTTILLTSSLGGSFQPASSLTSSFPVSLANFLYTAPENASGTTTITARAGNVQAATAIQIVCEVAPATTVAPLAPPSAGDGGLLNSSNAGYLPAALAIAAAAAVLGLTAATRRFAAATADVAGVTLPNPVASSRQPGGFALLASFVMLGVALLARRWH